MPSTIAIPLAEFLTQSNIEAFPAWELINGQATQKPQSTLFHSCLQRNLVNWISQQTDRSRRGQNGLSASSDGLRMKLLYVPE